MGASFIKGEYMKYQFEVEGKEADAILRGLGELPAKESMNLIANLVQQAQKQEQASKVTDAAAIPVQREDGITP
jgi:hypothetical protein